MEEMLDIYTRDGKYLGKKEKSICHNPNPGFYHKPAWIMIINSNNEILLQKRASVKKNNPDKWDIAAAGHVIAGEKVIDGAIREVYEELGVKTEEKEYIFGFEYILDFTYEIAQFYILRKNLDIKDLTLKEDEVSEVKWVSFEEFKKMFNSSEFVDYGEDCRKAIVERLEEVL